MRDVVKMRMHPGPPPDSLVLQAQASEMDTIELEEDDKHPWLSVAFEDYDADVVFSESWADLSKSSNARRQSMFESGRSASTHYKSLFATMKMNGRSENDMLRSVRSGSELSGGHLGQRSHKKNEETTTIDIQETTSTTTSTLAK